MLPLRLAALLALGTSAAGCARSGPPVQAIAPQVPAAPSPAALAGTEAALGAAPSPGARRLVAAERLRAAGIAPGAGARYETGVAFPYAVGLLAGRQPLHRSDLVVVVASLDEPAGAATLEAARVLAGRSVYVHEPARSVLFALWSGSIASEEALAGALGLRLWERARIRELVAVGGAPSGPDSLAGVAVHRIGPGDAAALAEAVLARTRALPVPEALLARPPAPAPR